MTQRLHSSGFPWAEVNTRHGGHTVLLSGTAPSAELRDAVVNRANSLPDVDTVDASGINVRSYNPANFSLRQSDEDVEIAASLPVSASTPGVAAAVVAHYGPSKDVGISYSDNIGRPNWPGALE